MNDAIKNIRKSILTMMYKSKSSHIGSAFSIVELLYVLYFEVLDIHPNDLKNYNRDIFILSKAHASAALYATLSYKGFFPLEWLNRYYIDDGILPGHLDMTTVPGVECSTGSLGHGLSIGLGMALAKIKKRQSGRVFVLLGDGECNEGSIWEGVMLASTHKVNNLIVIVDDNDLQGMGSDVIKQENLAERFRAFGWGSKEIDGHNIKAIKNTLLINNDSPTVIIAHTIKGKGVSFMENSLAWHYSSPNDTQYAAALAELDTIL